MVHCSHVDCCCGTVDLVGSHDVRPCGVALMRCLSQLGCVHCWCRFVVVHLSHLRLPQTLLSVSTMEHVMASCFVLKKSRHAVVCTVR